MMLDPETAMRVAAWRAEELQREAARYRLAGTIVPRWRRVAGQAVVNAGFRLLGARHAPAMVSVTRPGDC